MKRGTQIAYIPDRAEGNLKHPDVEFGFVTSLHKEFAFCRYWSKHHGGLRTLANSEATPLRNLVEHRSVAQRRVGEALTRIAAEEIYEL